MCYILIDEGLVGRVFLTMKSMNKHSHKFEKMDYPDETVGSRLAAEARKLANPLTDEQRAECLAGAKALIYGRTRIKKTAGARR